MSTRVSGASYEIYQPMTIEESRARRQQASVEAKKRGKFMPLAKFAGASALALTIAYSAGSAILRENDYEKATEACVSEIVGHKVNIGRANDGEALARPAAIFEKQLACEQNDNNPVLAQNHLDRGV